MRTARTAVQLIGLFTASVEAVIVRTPVHVTRIAGVQRRGSGCGKEFSWTKPRAYVGKVSDREGRMVKRGRREERARSGKGV